jgi:beta-glucosidase
MKPLFPFGYGLSYTQFAYSDLQISASGQGWKIRFKLANVGSRTGAEAAQLYLHPLQPSQDRPLQELKGFVKTFLNPGESRMVELDVSLQDLAFFNGQTRHWQIDRGPYEVRIARSSRDIVLAGRLLNEPPEQASATQKNEIADH